MLKQNNSSTHLGEALASNGTGIKRESSFRAALSRVSPRMITRADAVVGGGLVPPVFKPIYQDQLQLCRQTIRPQCNLSLKFNVSEDRQLDLKWSVRVVSGTLLFVIYRRPMREQTKFISKVKEYAIGNANSSTNLTLEHSEERHRAEATPLVDGKKVEDAAEHDNVIEVLEEVEEGIGTYEDENEEFTVVEKQRKISRRGKKEFTKGKIRCEKGFTYTVVLENTCTLFPSRSVDYDIRLVPRSPDPSTEEDPSRSNEESAKPDDRPEERSRGVVLLEAAERAAKIEDLLHFVSEISNIDPSSVMRKKQMVKKKKDEE